MSLDVIPGAISGSEFRQQLNTPSRTHSRLRTHPPAPTPTTLRNSATAHRPFPGVYRHSCTGSSSAVLLTCHAKWTHSGPSTQPLNTICSRPPCTTTASNVWYFLSLLLSAQNHFPRTSLHQKRSLTSRFSALHVRPIFFGFPSFNSYWGSMKDLGEC